MYSFSFGNFLFHVKYSFEMLDQFSVRARKPGLTYTMLWKTLHP